jgi:hypothetical protein
MISSTMELSYLQSLNDSLYRRAQKEEAMFLKYLKGAGYYCGLYYKTTTIVIMSIVSDATIWSVTYDRN